MIDILRFYLFPLCFWRAIRRFVEGVFSVIGVELLLRDLLLFWKADVAVNDVLQYLNLVWLLYLMPFIWGIFRFIPRRKVSVTIAGTDIRISCKVCDILKQEGDLVISVNTTFDTSTNDDFVSPRSLQGVFQSKFYSSKTSTVSDLDSEIRDALKDYQPVEVMTDGRKTKIKRYAVGTVAKLPKRKCFGAPAFRVYLVAMATSTISGATTMTMAQFAEAMQKLWCFLSENGSKTKLCVPLLGTGRSGLNCERMTIAKEIIFSFVAYARSSRIVDELQICITPQDYVKYGISLDELQDYLNVVSANDSLYHSSSHQVKSSIPISE